MFAWLMITLLAGFGGIITTSAFKETQKDPGRRIPESKGVNL
jgi:predicted outer membrane lipoprotein